MKTLYYTLLITGLLITASCRSVDKLVEQGRYDDAIVLATKKLAGKKKKKTKHIKALEEAFYKVNAYDLDQVARLKDIALSGDGAAWIKVYDYLVKIDNRQERVKPFLPLVSKDRYEGYFEILDTRPYFVEARAGAAEYLYKAGSELLASSLKSGDKLLAREAYHHLDRIGAYYADYKDIDELLLKSREAGITYILMDIENYDLNRDLSLKITRRMDRLNSMWTQYHNQPLDGLTYDLVSSMTITDVFVSPEEEDIRTFTESKELERWVTERDSQGEIVRDTLGNEVKYREVEIVRATLSEIFRTKRTTLRAEIIVTDFALGQVVGSEDFRHEVTFASDACNLQGDRRALSDDTRKRIDLSLSPFPTDFDMIDEALEEISRDIINYMRGWRT